MVKEKKCKVCRQIYAPTRPLQKVCSMQCAIELANNTKDRLQATKTRQDRRKAKERLKTRADWLREAQALVNKYVRLRDKDQGCISCNKPPNWHGQWHASHFRPTVQSAVRFNLWNIHKACSVCNNWKSGNLSSYEPAIRLKIGDEKVEWLKSQTQPHTYSVEYLAKLKKIFAKKIKQFERRMNK